MDSILWLLVLGAFFYFMMRAGGCGAHHGGAHHNHGRHGTAGGTGVQAHMDWAVKDPVCGAEGAPSKAPYSTEYRGRRYHFCSEACRDLFARDPERYATQAIEPDNGLRHAP